MIKIGVDGRVRTYKVALRARPDPPLLVRVPALEEVYHFPLTSTLVLYSTLATMSTLFG